MNNFMYLYSVLGEECKKRFTELTTEKKPVVPVEPEKPVIPEKPVVDPKVIEDTTEKLLENKNHSKSKDVDYYSPRYEDEKWENREGKKRGKKCKRDRYRDRDRDKREDSYGRSSHRSDFTTNSTSTPNSSVASSDLGYGRSFFYLIPWFQLRRTISILINMLLTEGWLCYKECYRFQEQLLVNQIILILVIPLLPTSPLLIIT